MLPHRSIPLGTLGVVFLLSIARGQGPAEDEVGVLPGLARQPSFKQYSGYLRAGDTRLLHYWYMASQRSPDTDPVVLWFNGGPGASSLIGALAENGPFRVVRKGKSLIVNPHSWNTVANVLYLEAPAGVGFSYDTSGQYVTNDDHTADDNYLAVQDFFRKFPALKERDFYVTGESYGGVYVPTLVERLLRAPNGTRLKGLAIGNGALDEEALGNSVIFFAYHHGFFDLDAWTRLIRYCCNGSASPEGCNFVHPRTKTATLCKAEVADVSRKIASLPLNPYNIYDECYGNSHLLAGSAGTMGRLSPYHKHLQVTLMGSTHSDEISSNCIDSKALATYLNREDVRAALHVEDCPLEWKSSSEVLNYTRQYWDMGPVVKKIVDSGRLRSLIYNGDIDTVCNFLGDQWFVRNLGYKNTTEYKQWILDSRLAGFYQSFDGNITYATVQGSGHMVPHDKPAQALYMISQFIANEPL